MLAPRAALEQGTSPISHTRSRATMSGYHGRDLEAMDFAENYHRWILADFRSYLGAQVVEVGAGTGAFSELLLAESGLRRLVAIEPDRGMHERLAERLHADPRVVHHRAFLSEVAGEYTSAADAVCYVNVLEHIADDAGELAVARETLRPGGHLCVFVPALPWLYSEFDASIGHCRRYTRRELVGKVRDAGFEIVRARYFDVAGILPWLIVFRLMRRTLVAGQVSAYDRFVVPVMRRLEGVLAPPVGKNLLLVGRKPSEGTSDHRDDAR
jgi:SAM-dependent methyltransferase